MQYRTKVMIVVAIAVGIALLYSCCGNMEGFSSCYRKQVVLLGDVNGGQDGGYAQFEWRKGQIYLSMQCTLPLSEAGVFTTLDGQYEVKMEGAGVEPISLGKLVRGAQRSYYLSDSLPGNYDAYDKIAVYLNTSGYESRKMLEGKL